MNRQVFEYALVRVIPRPERGELLNAGVIVYCKPLAFLGACCVLDVERLRALDTTADVHGVQRYLASVETICRGDQSAGVVAQEEPGRRFRWLTAPRSTVVQPGPVHTGLTADPEEELERLVELLVQ